VSGEDVANQFSVRLALLKPHPRILIAFGLAILCAGCASQAPATALSGYRSPCRRNSSASTHVVAPGDTIYHLSETYGVSAESLMAANGLSNPHDLRVGQILIIPNGESEQSNAPATASAFGPDPWSVAPADREFKWPVIAGVVSSPFGMRNGAMHDGVDIAAPAGTPVYAADDGKVIFAGRLHGYGNVVILQHSGGYVTVYAHNQRNLVDEGASVASGQEIAQIGDSGRASGPNLHFEVRYHNQAQNPLAYLPPPSNSTGITFARNGGS
jgi:lipoprotein NlpD